MNHFLDTLKLRLFAFLKIPLINYVRPKIIEINENISRVQIPLLSRNKNHLRSMYFGALSVGADLCIGLLATEAIKHSGKKVVLVFKDFKADFKKLAKGDVEFICEEGQQVQELVNKTIQTQSRQSQEIHGYAVVPDIDPKDVVMSFTLTLSLKDKSGS